jgi:hypothetical protein
MCSALVIMLMIFNILRQWVFFFLKRKFAKQKVFVSEYRKIVSISIKGSHTQKKSQGATTSLEDAIAYSVRTRYQ